MQGILLHVARATGAVLPRRVIVEITPGSGRLFIKNRVAADWSTSVGHAWMAAQVLARAPHHDARVRVEGASILEGGSAGLACGLLALAALRDENPPPFFATGAVVGQNGAIEGGAAAALKACAADEIAPVLGWRAPVFLHPAGIPPPDAKHVRPTAARDLAEAYSALMESAT